MALSGIALLSKCIVHLYNCLRYESRYQKGLWPFVSLEAVSVRKSILRFILKPVRMAFSELENGCSPEAVELLVNLEATCRFARRSW